MNVERGGIVFCAIQRERGPNSRGPLLLFALPAEINVCVLPACETPSILYRLLLKIELPAPVKCVSDGGWCFGQGV